MTDRITPERMGLSGNLLVIPAGTPTPAPVTPEQLDELARLYQQSVTPPHAVEGETVREALIRIDIATCAKAQVAAAFPALQATIESQAKEIERLTVQRNDLVTALDTERDAHAGTARENARLRSQLSPAALSGCHHCGELPPDKLCWWCGRTHPSRWIKETTRG